MLTKPQFILSYPLDINVLNPIIHYNGKESGDDLDSTWITKLQVHAEMSANLVKSKLKLNSCKRRQLRFSRL